MSDLRIPTNVSNDGREIWDWAKRLSEHTQRMDKMRRLRADIAKIGTECGDCDKWMKSRECPKEWNENGRQRGPSCASRICGQFIEKETSTKHRQKLTDELAALDAQSG